MRRIGIYRTVFPLISETFIEQQARALRSFEPVMLMRSLHGSITMDHIALERLPMGRLRAKLFSLTGASVLFWQPQQFKNIVLIHAHFGPDATYALPLARMLRVPLVVTFHGFDCTAQRRSLLTSGRFSDLRFLMMKKVLQKRAARVIAVSKFVEDRLLEQGFPRDKVVQHYIGVDTDTFCPSLRKTQERYILCVGRHTEKKGIDTLLHGFARIAHRYPDVSLIQVGSGQLTSKLSELAETLGIAQRIRFLGERFPKEVLKLMQGAELFVLPSRTAASGDSEALGIVFNEASACGIPVVATRHGGIPEAVINGETGILVKEDNDLALADAMDQLLGDPGVARQLGKRGREYVCDVFDLAKQTEKLEMLYEEIMV